METDRKKRPPKITIDGDAERVLSRLCETPSDDFFRRDLDSNILSSLVRIDTVEDYRRKKQ